MKRRVLYSLMLIAVASIVEGREANHLRGATSPYLLQHLYNPIDWHPWGDEALEKALEENKLIFVSVGYSSCHWCHVMAEESFENEAIAAFINRHFIAIKIDRESRPDLDEQFSLVTQLLTGTSGWPNSVFMTPEGAPFFAGGYFPPEAFLTVLSNVQDFWRQDSAGVSVEAARINATVSEYMTRKAAARAITSEAVAQAAAGIMEELDPFHGGYGVAPKFPREPLFLFLLDQAERTGDRRLLRAVTDALDGMIIGGVHDHVGGGFHRYAVDPEWRVPHFEKMLYTQALTGRLLVRAWSATDAQRYRWAAERLFDYVLRELRAPDGGFYSAQDADSLNAEGERVEGAFYTWTTTDLELLDDAGFATDVFHVTPEGDLDGANVLSLASNPEALAGDLGFEPDVFWARLERALQEMRVLRRARQAPFLDRKIILLWNGMMIQTLAEASYRLNRPEYYHAAETAARFLLDHMKTSQGLQRVSFEGSTGIAGQLPDYAALALALIAMHDFSPKQPADSLWLREARLLADEIRERFGAPETGFRMTESRSGMGDYIQVDDAEIPSGNALALSLFAKLKRRMQAPEIEQDGFRLAAALSGHALDAPLARAFALKALQELEGGETGPVRYTAKGAVRVELVYDRTKGNLGVEITIADGWHINAHQPLEDYLIATDLSVPGGPDLIVHYPEPAVKALSFSASPLAVYEGSIRLTTARDARSSRPENARQAKLSLQACSDEVCLEPEEIVFSLW